MTGERVCLDWWLGGWPLRWNDNFKKRLWRVICNDYGMLWV